MFISIFLYYYIFLLIYPSVALSLLIILPGFPITIEWSGTSKLTYELGAIKTSFPILILPTITALVPIHTSLPIIGVPFLLPLFSCPIVTPTAILQLSPIIALGFIITGPLWPIYNPLPIFVE